MRAIKLSIAIMTLTLSLSVAARGQFESDNFNITQTLSEQTAIHCDKQNTLVVFDIDNTLLTTNQMLGGDAWFTWQRELLKSGVKTPELAAPDFDSLLKIQAVLYSLSRMHPTDQINPLVVHDLQTKGFPVIALTSRGFEHHDATMRELSQNAYEMKQTSIGPQDGYAGPYLPYDLANPAQTGLSAEEVAAYKLGNPRKVMFQNGVFFGAGQHKGAMLKTLLNKVGFRPCGIVFIDDTPANTQKMWETYGDSAIDTTVIRYSLTDAMNEAFLVGDKTDVVSALTRLLELLGDLFK